jgi:hypothetical protein
MRSARTLAMLAALLLVSGCGLSLESLMPSQEPPPVEAWVADPQGDVSGPDTRWDIRTFGTRRTASGGVYRTTDVRASFYQVVALPPPGSMPRTDGAELAWLVCFDTAPGGWVVNPSMPELGCDFLLDGGALSPAEGGAGRLADGTYRLLGVTSGSPLAVSDTGSRATVVSQLPGSDTMVLSVGIEPLNLRSSGPSMLAVFLSGNRNGGVWNRTDQAPDGAMGAGFRP